MMVTKKLDFVLDLMLVYVEWRSVSAKVSICAFSESGSGKSTLIVELLRWVRANVNPEAKARVATVEHTTTLMEAVNEGIMEVWNLNNHPEPFETIDFAVKGYWPEDVKNVKSKLIEPNADSLREFPVRAFEGLSTLADYMGGSYVRGGLAARSGRKDRIGPAEETISFTDGSLAIGGNSRSHYNIVQTALRGAVAISHKLPVYVIWTAHEQKAKDDLSGMPIVGPEVFGNKATQHVPRWFANILYLSTKPVMVKDKVTGMDIVDNKYFLWLKTHYDPSMPSIPIRAKNAIPARFQKDVPAALEGGGLAIGTYLDMLVKYGQLVKEA